MALSDQGPIGAPIRGPGEGSGWEWSHPAAGDLVRWTMRQLAARRATASSPSPTDDNPGTGTVEAKALRNLAARAPSTMSSPSGSRYHRLPSAPGMPQCQMWISSRRPCEVSDRGQWLVAAEGEDRDFFSSV